MNALEYTKDEWKDLEKELLMGYSPVLGVTIRSISLKPKWGKWLLVIRYVCANECWVKFVDVGRLDQIAHCVKEALEDGKDGAKPDKFWDSP